jgi:aspartyl protease family protein
MSILAWLTFLVLVGFYFNEVLQDQRNPNSNPESRLGEGGATEVVLLRNKYGHYVTHGEINGRSVVFMVDTGATGVAVPLAVARRLGLQRGRPVVTQTANGQATAYVTSLDSVRVGEIEIRDVAASISPGLQMDEILLGMSFLRFIEFT